MKTDECRVRLFVNSDWIFAELWQILAEIDVWKDNIYWACVDQSVSTRNAAISLYLVNVGVVLVKCDKQVTKFTASSLVQHFQTSFCQIQCIFPSCKCGIKAFSLMESGRKSNSWDQVYYIPQPWLLAILPSINCRPCQNYPQSNLKEIHLDFGG